MADIYYSGYLGLDKILDSQHPVSAEHGVYAHD
jgi:tryptophan 2,3-dioxygenase